MIRAVIVDDEDASRMTLKGLLTRYVPDVQVVGEGEDVASGLEIIKQYTPDLVFLDIQMPDGSGFRLLELLAEIDFNVIFTTAFDQYAIKAIKFSALDYLLKPIVPDDLIKAVDKHNERIASPDLAISFQALRENLTPEPRKIVLHTFEGMHVVDTGDIIRCQSDDCYTNFFLDGGKRIIVSKTLKEIEEHLKGRDFMRPHKSHLVNINFIKTVVRNDGGYIVMKDGSEIPISRRKKELVMGIINKL
ncbi:MAG: DNA-binding response regulator [Bacteroidetes bacterium HGW-Bacteroidetes-6]|jgi:two-component system LytT family response regulator|nr:MAG: DNA-binding response regulator [Bacteroidetes bacterium HGW-Bacteroidetes-6]